MKQGRTTVDQLLSVLFWHDVVQRDDETGGRALTTQEACERSDPPLSPSTYWYHRRKRTQLWQKAKAMIDELLDEELPYAARRRALSILQVGNDRTAEKLILHLLGQRAMRDAGASGAITLVLEQFGSDDLGGCRPPEAETGADEDG